MSILDRNYINTSNALMLQMSGKQIHLQVPTKLFEVNRWILQAVNSRMLVQQQKMHESQVYHGKLVKVTVDDIWQIADAGDQEL